MTKVATEEKPRLSLGQIVGPLFLFSAYALAPHDAILFFLGLSGLFLCERWQMRGFAYALALLVLAAAFEHLCVTSHHLWQLGLEGAYALAFFLTAVHAEERTTLVESLAAKASTQTSSLSNLEEQLAQFQQESASQQVLTSEKIARLHKELEEGRTEFASLEILNEVLRKTTARATLERDNANQTLATAQHRVDALTQQLLEKEALGEDPSVTQELLNEARLEREQARLISETLARLHARENARARSLEERLLQLQAEKEATPPPAQPPSDELLHLQEKVKTLSGVEALYKQLRVQFAEKNEVLHQTRVELFRTDAQLQTLLLEKEQRELTLDLVPKEVRQELSALEKERARLEEENRSLQEIITHLMGETPAQKKK